MLFDIAYALKLLNLDSSSEYVGSVFFQKIISIFTKITSQGFELVGFRGS